MSRTLTLRGRYYRTLPIHDTGYEEEVLTLNADQTALVELHCWDIGCPGGPPVDPNYCVGMGYPETTEEAFRIMQTYIRPAMDAARRAGLLVCHVQAESIAKRHPASAEEAEEPPPSSSPAPPPALPGYRESILTRSHGEDYPTQSPLRDMDIPRIVYPEPGEPIVYQTGQFDRILRKRGIVNLIYTGFATDMCILNAPGGLGPMFALGYRVLLLREATLGVECPDTFHERLATRWAIRFFETHQGDTLGFQDVIANFEHWSTNAADAVRSHCER